MRQEAGKDSKDGVDVAKAYYSLRRLIPNPKLGRDAPYGQASKHYTQLGSSLYCICKASRCGLCLLSINHLFNHILLQFYVFFAPLIYMNKIRWKLLSPK